MSSQQAELILEALSKKYEKRTYHEHKILTNTLAPFFPTLSAKRVKMLTFFIELRLPPSEILPENHTSNSIVLTVSPGANPELPTISMHKLTKNAITVPSAGFAILLDYEKYLNADRLGESSVQKQISFWESSEYFCSMPKNKFYEVMRVAKGMAFSQGQCVYTQGQLLTDKESGSGIYVVRSGEFGCYRNDGKEIQASHFIEGHLFGALQLIAGKSKERATTVKCKTTEGVLYHFSEGVFNQYLRQYCQKLINSKQAKLIRFLPAPELLQKSKSFSFSHSLHTNTSKISYSDTVGSLHFRQHSTQIERDMQEKEFRAFPALRLEQIRQTATTSFYKSSLRESQRIESEGLGRSTYLSLKKQGPLKKYPLPAQRSNFPSSEFRDLDRIFAERQGLAVASQQVGIGRSEKGVWKRDMISSFYRQSIYGQLRRQLE